MVITMLATDRLGDADVVDDGEQHDEHDGIDQEGRRQLPDLAEVRREARCQRAGGGEAGREMSTVDQERERPVLEGLVDVERGAGRLRVLGASSAYARPVNAATVTPTANATQNAPPTRRRPGR